MANSVDPDQMPHSKKYPQDMLLWRNKNKYLPDILSYLDLCESGVPIYKFHYFLVI